MPVWNGYPLIYPDTGEYAFSSFALQVPPDRPIGYGLFIRATRVVHSLWSAVIAQPLGT